MKKTLNLALVGLASVASTGAFAQTINVPGPFEFWGTLTGPNAPFNTVVPNAATVGTAYLFGTSATVDSLNVSTTNTETWESEARVRLVNSAFPTLNAQLNFSSANLVYTAFSVAPGTVRNYTANGLVAASIPAGSTWEVTFFESFDDPGTGPDATGDSLIMTPGVFVVPPPPAAQDLGEINVNSSPVVVSVPTLSAAEVRWYKFTIPSAVDATLSTWMDVWTSNDGSGTLDTEIGVYNSNGVLRASDDDDGDGAFSFLSFGQGSGFQDLGSVISNGRDGVLAPGTYYLATGRFNVTFGAFNYLATSTGAATTVTYNLKLANNLAASANQTLSGTLNLNDTVFGGSYTRSITGTVKQGATTVGTITVSGINSSSTSFSGNIAASATGAATIEWDGSSFLLRKTNITLTGSNQSIGTVSMQNGDVDNSGEVDAADIDEVIANFGSSSDIASDVDVSGEVDAADIDVVIANFGGTND